MSSDSLEARAPDFLVQLVRTLRVAAVHDLTNDAAIQVSGELRQRLTEDLALFNTLALQISGDAVYVNGEFVKLRGAAYDAAAQARQMYERLGINEIKINAPLDEAELKQFLFAMQSALHSQTPADFARRTFAKVFLRPLEKAHKVGIDERVALARTYAQLVVILQESALLIERKKPLALVRIRRALHELVRAAENQRSLLAGLTRFDELRGDSAPHCAAVGALVLLMGLELGLSKKSIVALVMSALLHHLVEAPDDRPVATAVALAESMPSTEVVERLSIVLEAAAVEISGKKGVIPSVAARCVAVACAFDRLTRAKGFEPGLRPDQALRLLIEHSGVRYDARVVRLLTSIVGLYPVGSLVRLSGGQLAVVLTAPGGDGPASRPTVRVIEDKGAPASFLLELAREPNLAILECVDARDNDVNVVHFLLA